MDAAAEYKLLCQLIADNRNREAAERLNAWFDGKSAGRQEAAVGLLNRIAALQENVLRGVISQADANLENNRITQALLDLAKQLDETADPAAALRGRGNRWLLLVAGAVVVLIAGWIWASGNKGPRTPPASGAATETTRAAADTTVVRGIVYLPGAGNRPAAGAHLDFDVGRARCVTDESGHFQVPVPAAEGAIVKLLIDYEGRNRYNRNYTVSGKEPLLTTLNP